MFLLDTNVLSERRKGAKADPGVVDRRKGSRAFRGNQGKNIGVAWRRVNAAGKEAFRQPLAFRRSRRNVRCGRRKAFTIMQLLFPKNPKTSALEPVADETAVRAGRKNRWIARNATAHPEIEPDFPAIGGTTFFFLLFLFLFFFVFFFFLCVFGSVTYCSSGHLRGQDDDRTARAKRPQPGSRLPARRSWPSTGPARAATPFCSVRTSRTRTQAGGQRRSVMAPAFLSRLLPTRWGRRATAAS